MARTLKLVFSKESIQKSWNYSSRDYCTHCGNHHCGDPSGVKGTKSLKKSKGTTNGKRYQKDSMSFYTDDDG
jgi:hypothetical protein